MKVIVNDRYVDLAPGMTVRHALIGAGMLSHVEAGMKVFDERGNEVGLDGALDDNSRIYVGREEKP